VPTLGTPNGTAEDYLGWDLGGMRNGFLLECMEVSSEDCPKCMASEAWNNANMTARIACSSVIHPDNCGGFRKSRVTQRDFA